jgi:hypothetical protein
MKWILIGVTLLIMVAAVLIVAIPAKAPTTSPTATSTPAYATLEDLIGVESPTIGATVSSPLVVSGKARGSWYFEASFPYELLDAQGKSIAQGPVQAQGDWMTSEYVQFSTSITFPTQPSGSHGTLILKKDNPSGLPQNDKSLSSSDRLQVIFN